MYLPKIHQSHPIAPIEVVPQPHGAVSTVPFAQKPGLPIRRDRDPILSFSGFLNVSVGQL